MQRPNAQRPQTSTGSSYYNNPSPNKPNVTNQILENQNDNRINTLTDQGEKICCPRKAAKNKLFTCVLHLFFIRRFVP